MPSSVFQGYLLERFSAPQNVKSVQEVSKCRQSRFPKSDRRYWESRVFKNSYTRQGRVHEVGEYSVKMQFRGRRESFQLGTANRASAAEKAKRIYLSLQTVGWDETLTEFKGKSQDQNSSVTVGEFLRAAEAVTNLAPRTFAGYARSFRSIVAAIEKIPANDRIRYDRKNGGHKKWLETIESVPLEKITSDKVERWKRYFVSERSEDPLSERKAKTSCNSLMANARSLFCESRVLRHLRSGMEISNPFDGVDFYPKSKSRYTSKIDGQHLIQKSLMLNAPRRHGESVEEFHNRREVFKAFLLFMYCGPRRKEVDLLTWEQIDLENCTLEIKHTKYFRPKTETAVGIIDFDKEVSHIFGEFRRESPNAVFVLDGGKPKPNVSYSYYRAERTFSELITWLRDYETSEGLRPFLDVQKPIHELRKEVGAILNCRYGIFAAQRVLRHAEISTTANTYVDQKEKISVGLRLTND